jgi:hypothetical protein
MEQLYTERGLVQKQLAGDAARPWSLALVTMIAFFLPAGGAVLAVRNMARLGEIDARRSTELTVATLVVFAAGYSVLVLVAHPTSSQQPNPSPAATGLLSLGTAFGAFLFQRRAFARWRNADPGRRTEAWYKAVGWGIAYQLLTLVVGIPVVLILAIIASIGA